MFQMNIYLVERTDGEKPDFEERIIESFVCYATTEHEAHEMSPCSVKESSFIDWNTTKGETREKIEPVFGNPFAMDTKLVKEKLYVLPSVNGYWVKNPKDICVTLLGQAKPEQQVKVICINEM